MMRALLDCPVHAILELGERRPDDDHRPLVDTADPPAGSLKTEDNEAQWGVHPMTAAPPGRPLPPN